MKRRYVPLEAGLLIEWRLAGEKGWRSKRMGLVTQVIPDPTGNPTPMAFVVGVRGQIRAVVKS